MSEMVYLKICVILYSTQFILHSAGDNLLKPLPVYQSSTYLYYDTAAAYFSNNGFKEDAQSHFSCSETVDNQADEDPWFVVDLGQQYHIGHVTLRAISHYSKSFSNFIVGLSNEFSPTNPPKRGAYVLCGQHLGEADGDDWVNSTVHCDTDAPMARYVIIQQPEEIASILICELEVFEPNDTGSTKNLALNRTANLSLWNIKSNAGWEGAGDVVDGFLYTCDRASHNHDPDPWFVVDLGREHSIHHVRLIKRISDQHGFVVGLTHNFTRTNRSIRGSYEICGLHRNFAERVTHVTMNCSEGLPPSRYVIVQLPDTESIGRLSFFELEVYDVNDSSVNVALGRPAYQSLNTNTASMGVDGDPESYQYSLYTPDSDPWFVVDLLQPNSVEEVVIYYKDYCCENFEVGLVNNITEEDPNKITLPARGTYPICGDDTGVVKTLFLAQHVVRCNSTTPPGRYVIIRQPEGIKSQMVICMINVFWKVGNEEHEAAERPMQVMFNGTDDSLLTQGCPSWTIHRGHLSEGGREYEQYSNVSACLKYCEEMSACLAADFDGDTGCWLHTNPDDLMVRLKVDWVCTQYVINRTCMADLVSIEQVVKNIDWRSPAIILATLFATSILINILVGIHHLRYHVSWIRKSRILEFQQMSEMNSEA